VRNEEGVLLRTVEEEMHWWKEHFERVLGHLKHVKAWLKPNLHKIKKTVITLPGFGLILAELAA